MPDALWKSRARDLSKLYVIAITVNMAAAFGQSPPSTTAKTAFSGTASCRSCHQRFYKLWSTSYHGKAMRPFTPEFASAELTSQVEPIVIGNHQYFFKSDESRGWVTEQVGSDVKKHRIHHVMGGKNVFYFLTQLDRGRLQVLPVAYDVKRHKWLDTPASALRHIAPEADELLDWREREFTFNASCYGCHVSQLSTNYDAKTNTYDTTWAEPGINCETCHGNGSEHVRVFAQAALRSESPRDLHLISMSSLTTTLRDQACAACHAKLMFLSNAFKPGERFFDHFDLVTLEDRDYYPDGRDLGENYTYTAWLMNPCAAAGQLECLHCHTSSGRYRFAEMAGKNANGACLPCHAKRVEKIASHSHHTPDGPAGTCTACHMPKTSFARMIRSDHSLRPPMPASTLAFESPNACNLCHKDKDAAWANAHVRSWYGDGYQAPTLKAAALVKAARTGDWRKLPQIGAYLAEAKRDEVFATSLVRLLSSCADDAKWPILLRAARDPSPLVRSSAAIALANCPQPEALDALLNAAADQHRVVRIRAGAALAAWGRYVEDANQRAIMKRAQLEFVTAMRSRPDNPGAFLSLGNYYLNSGEVTQAIEAFESAKRVDPGSAPARINAALAYDMAGDSKRAESCLHEAIKLAPKCAAAHLNLGLLLGAKGNRAEAIGALRNALTYDPRSAVAAYNLAVLVAAEHPAEAVVLCELAVRLEPNVPRYAYTLAFYHRKTGNTDAAIRVLEDLITRHPDFADAHQLLGRVHFERGDKAAALRVYRRAADEQSLREDARAFFAAQASELSQAGD